MAEISRPDIDVSVNPPDEPVFAHCDRRLISQAVTNLVKNASEAIIASDRSSDDPGWIRVELEQVEGKIRISVIDNGKGLPRENRHRLLEPYMTTREKGTGLGLAIVGKIAEEHGGGVSLHDAPQVEEGGHGAMVRIEFPLGESEVSDRQNASGVQLAASDEQLIE